METFAVLGIDIAKATFDVCLISQGKHFFRKFPNDEIGFKSLEGFLYKKEVSLLHACMEATSVYYLSLANFLNKIGFKVSVVNPFKIKGFAQSQLSRTKTDKSDAQLIAAYCQTFLPSEYKPVPEVNRELQELVQRLEALTAMKLSEKNRLSIASERLAGFILESINQIDRQIKQIEKILLEKINSEGTLIEQAQLLDSIPGVSNKTIGIILAYISHMNFESSKKLAAYFGLNPRHKLSGTSVRGCSNISKMGNSRLRKTLYMPALVAMRHNPIIAAFCQRLESKGKPKKVVIVAAMRKLLDIIHGVLKNRRSFDPQYSNA